MVQARWERANAFLAATGVKMRGVSSTAMYLTGFLTQATTVAIVIIGVHLIAERQLTMGALIAVSMLSGRALAPAGQVIGLLMQYQGARTAMTSLGADHGQTGGAPGRRDLHPPPAAARRDRVPQRPLRLPEPQGCGARGISFKIARASAWR